MAKSEELRLNVNVKGAKDVDKLADSLEDVEKGAKQADRALDRVGSGGKVDKFISNLKEAADEAENVGKALDSIKKFAPQVDDSDIAAVVLNLRKVGVEFDEIEAKAKELGDTLNTLNSPKVQDLGTNLETTNTKLGQTAERATNARGVLANMIGNSAQDVTGLSSSLGVAIGQMGEYSADALLAGANTKQAFKEMALVAGPIAALAALQTGISIVQGSIAGWRKQQEAFTKQQRDFNDAVEESGSQFQAVSDLIEDSVLLQPAPEMNFVQTMINDIPFLGRMLDDTAESAMTVAEAMALAGISQQEWFDAMRVDLPGGLQRYTDLLDTLEQLNDTGQITDETYELLNEQFVRQGQVVAANAAQMQIAGGVVARSLDNINTALDENAAKLRVQEALWGALIADMTDEDGIVGTADGAADAYNQLQRELGLTNEQMDALVQQKLDEHMADVAAAEEEAAEQAREFAQAVADLNDQIADIDADDLSNISDALAEALDVGGVAVNLQVEEAQVRGQIAETAKEIQEFVDEHGEVNWSVVLDPQASAAGFDPVLAGMIGELQDQLQTGIVNAFQSGGIDAATQFSGEFRNQLIEMGMSPAQVTEFMGLPPGGDIPLFLQPIIDAEAKADALAILESIKGINPDDPIAAHLALRVQTGTIQPVIAEIVGLLLAQNLGVDVTPQLAEFTPDQLAQAQAQIDAAGYTAEVEVGANTTPADDAIGEVEGSDYEATIDAVAETADAAQKLLDEASRHRPAPLVAIATNTNTAKADLDAVAADRNSEIWVRLPNYNSTDRELEFLARDRHSNIIVHTVSTGGGGGGPSPGTLAAPLAAGPMAMATAGVAPLAAPAAVAPMSISPVTMTPVAAAPNVVNNFSVAVSAAVIGNPHEVDRAVSKALRRHQRLNGRRN